MKLELWVLGKTNSPNLKREEDEFVQRISKYVPFEVKVIDTGKLKHKDKTKQKEAEAKKVLNKIDVSDLLILLDEQGKTHTSRNFAKLVERLFHSGKKRIVFLVGGAFGFDQSLYNRAEQKLSLSAMTYSHQLIRLVFLEQLYRAFTIIRNEPYHND